MPWREVDQRREFVRLAMQEGVNRRELCRRPGTGHGQVSLEQGANTPPKQLRRLCFLATGKRFVAETCRRLS
jgi:hypothetical protein